MKRNDKEQLVRELKTKITGAQALYFTDFTGLNVKRMTALRRELRKAGVEYVVIKNTLALRAVNESGLTGVRHDDARGAPQARRSSPTSPRPTTRSRSSRAACSTACWRAP